MLERKKEKKRFIHLQGLYLICILKKEYRQHTDLSDLCSTSTPRTEIHRTEISLVKLQYCSTKNFDSMRNYDISKCLTQQWKIQSLLLKNECSVKVPFCSGITDASDLIKVFI